ncbi:autotransporter assembly complex protein TamA [Pararhodospirillum photometricum]|nr:BamA/TamA family outer membrane protein [Pararhodospirillum photometricum]
MRSRPPPHLGLLLSIIVVLAGAVRADEPPEEALVYGVSLDVNSEDNSLKPYLERVSRLVSLRDDPPFSGAGLRRRMEADLELFHKALRSRGYYAAATKGAVETGDKPAKVEIQVEAGPLYTLEAVNIEEITPEISTDSPSLWPAERAAQAAGLALGSPALADDVLKGEGTVALGRQREGYPLARVTDRVVVVDHSRKTMKVTYKLESGSRATFGSLRVTGLAEVKESYVLAMRPWQEGELYDERQLREFRRRLSETRLFATLDLAPDTAVDESGRVPIVLVVTEGPPRTISGGLSYGTDQGPGATGRWEHRNFLGGGETLRVEAVGALTQQALTGQFRKPYFLDPRQTLTGTARLAREDQEAYTGYTNEVGVGIERQLSDAWRVTGGVVLDYDRLTWPDDDNDTLHDQSLVGLPFQVVRDTSNSPLDPTTGTRAALGLTPLAGLVSETTTAFLVADLTGSVYQAIWEDRVVLAGRARLSSLLGADLGHVPPNRRLYAGGGGSVRGFGHQRIGPLASDGDPLGGRSAAEIGAELRIRITESIGLVPFLEGGTVGTDPWPTVSESVRWGAGLGVRYHTGFGPIRADIGVPLNPRKDDDSFQVYISLGQAF